MLLIFFFFQAEDGIRDLTVTGVQTCALPICFNSRLLGKGRRLDLAVKPDEGLLPRSHRHNKAMSNMTYMQVVLTPRPPGPEGPSRREGGCGRIVPYGTILVPWRTNIMRAIRDNLGFLLAKALQRWNELL